MTHEMSSNEPDSSVSALGAPRLLSAMAVAVLAVACSASSDSASSSDANQGPGLESSEIGSCNYTSPFTREAECREFTGAEWDVATAQQECATLAGEFTEGLACSTTYRLGTCAIPSEDGLDYIVSSYGDAENCELQQTGCELFGGGSWVSEGLCGDGGNGGGGNNVFIQPTLECRDPLDGEPSGQSAKGQVCTWQAISGCTEEGRRFQDYASCDVVRTQRPYYPAPAAANADQADSRLQDPEYLAELDWVKSQVQASACVCCHSTETAPEGPSNWYIESPGNWIHSLGDSGIALGANAISSVALGAYPAADNNGFHREITGFPSTDPDRMLAFFQGEMTYRGLTNEDFAGFAPFGGPIYDQLVYEPEACAPNVGVAADGTIRWQGGDARYVYVLEAGSENPTIPPNLDKPTGTLWRLDVAAEDDPVASASVQYGVVPAGMSQRIPQFGNPPPLQGGRQYYLYVSRDVGIPITRCLFTRE